MSRLRARYSSDLKKKVMNKDFVKLCKSSRRQADDCLSLILERDRAVKLGTDSQRLSIRIADMLSQLQSNKLELERDLTALEEQADPKYILASACHY